MTLVSFFTKVRSKKGRKTMNESIAYARGIDAYHEGDSLNDNPYDVYDSGYREWLNGWYDAAGMVANVA